MIHEKLKNHKCELCDKTFSLSADLKNHITRVHELIKNHKCKQCDKAYSLPTDLKKHMNNVHAEL